MKFQPKSEQQIADESQFTPWREGIYDFEVAAGEDRTSKQGNEMIALIVKVYDHDGNSRTVFDYLLESVAYKLRHAAEACGLSHLYDGGTLEGSDFQGRTGKLKLGIQPAQNGYAAKNVVKDYVIENKSQGTMFGAAAAAKTPDIDDEIPF